MIVCEGMDGTGKSTLVEQLCADLNLPMHERASDSIKGPVENLAEWTKNDVDTWPKQELAVYDRHPLISEFIYGPVTRGRLPDGFSTGTMAFPYKKFTDRALLIICDPGIDTILKNLYADPHAQMAGVVDNATLMHMMYGHTLLTWPWDANGMVTKYNYTKPGAYNRLLEIAERHVDRLNYAR